MKGQLYLCVILVLCFCLCNGQEQEKKKKRGKRQPIKIKPGAMLQALTINYPLSMFNVDATAKNWRDKAVFDKDLKRLSDSDKPYTDIARAQDLEDIWLYENWFYGMKDGVIMESGALDGMLFSTSYMFEKFANWSAIHVG